MARRNRRIPHIALLSFTVAAAAAAECDPAARIEVDAGRHARLDAISGAANPARGALDRKVFDLGAMNDSYFKALTYAPQYLDLPVSAFLLPEPPENSSERTAAELRDLHRLARERRSPAAIERALELAGVYYRPQATAADPDWSALRRNLFFTGRCLDARLDPEILPETANLLARVWSDASFYIWALKYRYNRIRPYRLDPTLEAITDPNFPAYPSAHSGNSYVAALVLSELLPEQRRELLANAAELAFSREILGVHYASDSSSGEQFGHAFVKRLLESPPFRADLERARRELLGARARAAAPVAAATSCACAESATRAPDSACAKANG